METVLVIVIAVVVLGGVAAGFVVAGRRRGGVELEPPPGARPGAVASPPAAPQPEVDDEEAPEVESGVPAASDIVDAPVDVLPADEPVGAEPAVAERPRFRDRLTKARSAFAGFLGRATIDDDTWEDLEEALLRADVGVALSAELLDVLRRRVKDEAIREPAALTEALKDELKARLQADRTLSGAATPPTVWLFVGVNGVGKTTTIGKVAKAEIGVGRTVVMAAGDTFRAAAAEQLGTWAERTGATLVRGAEGADPSSVVFDAVESAAARGADLVLADTAGRLHTKSNLMDELRKVRRVAEKGAGTVTEVLLVLDATTGQNGLVQAREFTSAVEVTGVVLTKLDGSAKGGIVLAIQHELGIPVKLVGLGETADDLVPFDPDEFVEALLS